MFRRQATTLSILRYALVMTIHAIAPAHAQSFDNVHLVAERPGSTSPRPASTCGPSGILSAQASASRPREDQRDAPAKLTVCRWSAPARPPPRGPPRHA